MNEKPIEQMTLTELLQHTQKIIRLLASYIADELRKIQREKK